MITVVCDDSLTRSVPAEVLQRAADQTLRHPSSNPAAVDLTILQTGDPQIQALNRDYSGLDAPTDVLSFLADEIDPESGVRYLGDVVISIPRAAEQATRAGHSLETEAQLLTVHGVLHLLGYDHTGADEKARMWAVQGEILEQLGLGGINVLET